MLLSVSMKMDTALRAQVESSAMYLYLDVAGAHFSWALDLGALAVQINWTKWAGMGQVQQEAQNELGLGWSKVNRHGQRV